MKRQKTIPTNGMVCDNGVALDEMIDKMDMVIEHQERVDARLKRLSWKSTEIRGGGRCCLLSRNDSILSHQIQLGKRPEPRTMPSLIALAGMDLGIEMASMRLFHHALEVVVRRPKANHV